MHHFEFSTTGFRDDLSAIRENCNGIEGKALADRMRDACIAAGAECDEVFDEDFG